MNSKETLARKSLIQTLAGGYPSSKQQLTEDVIDAYVLATEGASIEALRLACKRFMEGDVPGHNNAFMPTAPELSSQARLFHGVISPPERLDTVEYRMGALPPTGKVPLGPLVVDFGHGPIDLTRMTEAEKDEVFRTKGESARPNLRLVK